MRPTGFRGCREPLDSEKAKSHVVLVFGRRVKSQVKAEQHPNPALLLGRSVRKFLASDVK